MKSSPCPLRFHVCLPVLLVATLWAGCANIFVPKHKVMVDAIAAPDAPKPSGMSYRLVAKQSVVSSVPVQVPVVKACVDAALTGIGMYEPPPNVAPDLFIEVGYGNSTSPRADPAARETFLQLSARANPDRSLEKGTGRELWDVRVGVFGIAGRMETAMPLLCTVAANYAATDTQVEAKIDIPQNDPTVAAVRQNAIKALESRSAPAQIRPLPAPPPEPPAAGATPGGATPPAGTPGVPPA